jgi:hypothetical protein
VRFLLLLLLTAPLDEDDEALDKWFRSRIPAGHAKKEDPLPVDPPPVRIEVPPALSKALPPETIQAIVQGDLTAVQSACGSWPPTASWPARSRKPKEGRSSTT